MRVFNVTVNGQTYEVEIEEVGQNAEVSASPAPRAVAPKAEKPAPKAAPAAKAAPVDGTPVKAPMPGTILDVKVKVGDQVASGQAVCVLEAMKMENEIPAPRAGKVVSVLVSKGATVESGNVLVVLE